MAGVQRYVVVRLQQRIGAGRGYEADRVLAVVQVSFNRAAGSGVLDENAPNPAPISTVFRAEPRSLGKSAELPAQYGAIEKRWSSLDFMDS